MKKLLLGFLMLFAFSAFAQDPSLPIDMEDPADDAWIGQSGSVYSLETDLFSPNTVGKIVGGTDQWNSRIDLALGTYIDMTTADKTFTFEFYTTEAVPMTGLFQIGLEKDGGYVIEMQFTTDGAIGWETITLDFNGATNGWPNAGEPVVYGNYAQVSIFTNFGDWGTSTYYFDDIAGAANGAVVGADPGPTTQPTPQPSADAVDVISIYSDVYTDLQNFWHPGWGQATVYSDELIPGISPDDHITKLKFLTYDAVVLDGAANPTNVGSMEYVHIDIWSIDDTPIRIYILDGGSEPHVPLTLLANQWNSFDIPISDFVGANFAAFWGFKFESGNWSPGQSELVYMDNIYFWKTPGPAFTPENASSNVQIDVNPSVSFPMSVAMADDSPITDADIPTIITFKETDNSGADVPFSGTINGAEDLITITPDANLDLNQVYYLELGNELIKYQGGSLIEGENVSFSTLSGPFDLPITFDESTVNYGIGDWGGNASSLVVDPTDPLNMVAETMDADYEWSGTFLNGPNGTGLDSPIPFGPGDTKMSMRVWSPEADVPIIFKVENGSNGGIAAEVTVNTTMASAWETMIFDLDGFVDFAQDYHKVVLLFNAGINEPGSTYYWDDIDLVISPNTWQGDDLIVPDDWFTAENWSKGTVPTTEDVIIPAGAENFPFIMNPIEVATCGALTVEAGAFIQLNYDGYLTVFGTTLCDGAIEIMSDETGMGGSFIENGIDPLSTGTFTYMRNTLGNGALGDPSGWHFISSPVSTFGTDDIWDYYMNYYDEPTSMWVQYGGSPTIPCTPAPNMNMGIMQGWSVKQDLMYEANGCTGGTGQEIDFTGPITSLYSGPQTFNGTATDPLGDFDNNWNLIGNPYPATWYYEDMYWAGLPLGWDDAMYMYDDVTQNYLTWVGGVGNANNGYVVPTQAVFFHGDGSEATMPLNMDPSELYHSNYPFTKSEVSNLLALKVTGEYSSDETFIRFNEDATLAFDGKYDAYKLITGGENVPSLYTHAGNDNLSINSQPETNMVPMSFTTSQNGTFTIEATETSDFSIIVLEDKFTGEQIDLLAGSYTFDFNTGDLSDRFIVHFTPLGVEEATANNVKIWAVGNDIIVNVPAQVTGQIAVYNMMGQEVVNSNIESVETKIPVSNVNTYYLVKVISNSNTVTGKIYVK